MAIADAAGTVLERLSYDAFGQRREGESWNPLFDPFNDMSVQTVLDITTRGFTQHEHVDHANIIHMGGRIYDPVTGRFAQADPIVQAPENGQSLNRYSYVFNNPLSYTDPTGYSAQGTICEQKDLNGGVEDLCTMGGSGDEIQAVNADIPTDPTTEGDGETEEEATEEANNSTATETDTASEGAFDNDGAGRESESDSSNARAPVVCDPNCPDPTTSIDVEPLFNPDLADNITFTENEDGDFNVRITGTLAAKTEQDAEDLSPRKVKRSIERFKGKVRIDGVKYRLTTEITIIDDPELADWVYVVGLTNSAQRGKSGIGNPLTLNPNFFQSKTAAHELTHTFGSGHSLNETGRINSYKRKSNNRGRIVDQRNLKPGDMRDLLIYMQSRGSNEN